MKNQTPKLNWPLIGNDHIFEFLTRSLANKNISGSYIFTGPANIGKNTAAYFFARSLICESVDRSVLPCGKCATCLEAAKSLHSDIYLIKRAADKKNISIEQIRSFIRTLGMSSFLNSYKIGIIKGAESLSEGAVNALLKTLEEPKNKVIIILTVTDLDALPETIISRSQILRFRPVGGDAIYDDLVKNYKAQRSQAKNLSRLAAGRPALALKFFQDGDFFNDYKNYVNLFFEFIRADLNRRYKTIDNLVGEKSGGQDAVKSAGKILEIWQNLTRDLMLAELDLADLAQHQAFEKELAGFKGRGKLVSLVDSLNILKSAKRFLEANVQPRLAFEYLAVNLHNF